MDDLLMQRINRLEEELKIFQDKSLNNEKMIAEHTTEIQELRKTTDLLYEGQFYARLTEEVYRDVVPKYFLNEEGNERTDYKQPHPNELERQIEKIPRHSERRNAIKKLEELEEKNKFDKELRRHMQKVMDKRNKVAHPSPLKKQKLDEIAGDSDSYLKRAIAFADERYKNKLFQ